MPGEFDDAVNKALDDYELMRRKAAALDLIQDLRGTPYFAIQVKEILDTLYVPDATLSPQPKE